MKFVCPRCHAALTISARLVPEAGAWAICPKCRERFYLKAKPVDLGTSTYQKTVSPGRERSAEAQKLVNRLRVRNNAEVTAEPNDFGNGFEPVTVFPAPAPNHFAYGVGVIVLVSLFLGVLVSVFNSADARPSAPAATSFPAAPPYDSDGLRGDLISLRKELNQRKNIVRHITYSGSESRIFKHFLSQLAPDKCQDIVSIKIWSTDTIRGFKATAVCAADQLLIPELDVRWEGETVHATMADQAGEITIDLNPHQSLSSNN